LDEIQQAIRRIAFDINNQIAGLQNVIESNSSDHQLRSLNNLRNCVKSAASVVSSASTTLGVDRSDRFSVSYESEFGDCFLLEPGETMLRWISSNTVYEFEEERDAESSLSGPKPASGKSLQLVGEGKESDQSDSDGELEAEIIQSLLRRGKDKLASREFEAAERHFRNCLARASSNGSAVSLHRVLGSRSEIMTLLLSTYRLQEKWDEAHSLLTEKIALESRGSSKANQVVLADMLILVEVLLKKCAYSEALLYGRRALKSYRKLGSEGTLSVQDSLGLLCQVCKAASNHDEEDAYGAILSDILQQCEPAAKSTTATVSAGHDPEPTTSPTASTIKREGSVESPSVQNLSSPDTLESNNSWLSSGQLTSTSATRTHHRESSLSSLGSAGPASPYTTNTSLSTASREGLPALKDSCLSLPTDTSASQSLPLKLVRLEDTSEQLKVGNDSQALPTSKSTSSVTLTPASDQMSARSASVHEPSKTQKIMTTAIGDLMDEASDVTETADSPKPAVLKWQPSMTVMPVEIDRLEVGFKRPFNREVSQLVRLRNPNSGPVVFKVGTTTPKQYCVRPNWGRIEAGDEFQVLIIKVPMDKDPPLEENSRDKFLFQSVAVTADEQLDSHALISSHINTLLSSPNTKFLTQDKKISVSFFLPEAEPAEEPAATTEAPAATTKAVAPEFTGEDTLGYKGPGSFLK
jgi:hypothetical protein